MAQEGVIELLTRWHRRLRESQFAHYEAGKYFDRRQKALGIVTVVCSLGSGGIAVELLRTDVSEALFYMIVGFNTLGGILAGVQTGVDDGGRAERHRRSGAHYGAVRRHVEQALALGEDYLNEHAQVIDDIRSEINELSENSPNVPLGIFKRVLRDFDILAEAEQTH